MTTRPEEATGSLAEQAAAFLYREARLLDEGSLDEWLGLFSPEATYVAPLGDQVGSGEPTILQDDATLRMQRVYRLTSTPAYAQRPASRTVRAVTNVEIVEQASTDEGDELDVACVQVIHEMRVGDPRQYGLGTPRSLASRVRYKLGRSEQGWRILHKEVWMLDRGEPSDNLSIVL